MNIPKFDISEYTRCSYCGNAFTSQFNRNIYYSKLCLHKLCENCYRSYVLPGKVIYKCKACNESAPLSEVKDFSIKPQDELFYEADIKIRRLILSKFMYKNKNSFQSEIEYDDYLEKIEELIEKYYDKEISDTFKGDQTKEELNINLIKRTEELNTLNRMKRIKDPNNLYNSKIDFINENEESNPIIEIKDKEMVVEPEIKTNVRNYRLPIYHENAPIILNRNFKKKVKAGGYDQEKVFESYAIYAKGGLE